MPPPDRADATGTAERSRAGAFVAVLGAYLAAAGAAGALGWELRGHHPLLVAGAADVGATLVVFAASLLCDNSSLYDPYWSVAPIPIAAFYAWTALAPSSDPVRRLVVLALIALWGLRLTWNWTRGWGGLGHEDWRYRDMRVKAGRGYWLASLFALHLLPTAIVFLGLLPVWAACSLGAQPLGWRDLVAAGVCFTAIIIETRADEQLRQFVLSNPEPGTILDSGLWASSRHPNYFGEITFWWGLYLFAVAAARGAWWTLAGPLAITLLFVGISIPLMERRMLERRPYYYAEHCKRVSALIPWIRRG